MVVNSCEVLVFSLLEEEVQPMPTQEYVHEAVGAAVQRDLDYVCHVWGMVADGRGA